MQLNWKNLKEVVGNLVTSNKLSQEEAQRLQSAVDADATAEAVPPAAAPLAAATITAEAATGAGAAIAAVVTPAAPAPVAAVVPPVAPVAPVAATPAPATPTASEVSELETLRAENARLKASQNQTITAAAVPAGDVGNGNASASGDDVNPHFANLKRIKEKYGKFGLTAEINLGEES